MKKCIRQTGIILIFSVALGCHRKEKSQTGNQDREKFHLFLLVGQSNMAGRGIIEHEETIPHPRVLTLTRDEKWVPAIDPYILIKKLPA